MAEFKILKEGTRLSGLVTDTENQPPRECHNCVYYKHDTCRHPVVMVDPEVNGVSGKPKPVGDHWCCDFFTSPGRILLFCLRHGEDDGDELIGGWNDDPLDEKGISDAKEAAKFLEDKGIKKIVCSDMKRTEETAKIVAEHLGIKNITTDFRARTWNKGYWNGAEKTEENKAILNEYKDNPHWVIDDGESHFQFEERNDELLDAYIEDAKKNGVILIVEHNSGIKQAQRYVAASKTNSDKTLRSDNNDPDSVAPGGILRVSEKNGELYDKIVFKDAKPNREGARETERKEK